MAKDSSGVEKRRFPKKEEDQVEQAFEELAKRLEESKKKLPDVDDEPTKPISKTPVEVEEETLDPLDDESVTEDQDEEPQDKDELEKIEEEDTVEKEDSKDSEIAEDDEEESEEEIEEQSDTSETDVDEESEDETYPSTPKPTFESSQPVYRNIKTPEDIDQPEDSSAPVVEGLTGKSFEEPPTRPVDRPVFADRDTAFQSTRYPHPPTPPTEVPNARIPSAPAINQNEGDKQVVFSNVGTDESDLDTLTYGDEVHIPNLKNAPGQEPVNPNIRVGQGSIANPDLKSNLDPSNYFNKHQMEHPSKRDIRSHLIILGLIGLAVVGATYYLLKYQFNQPELSATPAPSSQPLSESTPVPTATPIAIDRGEVTVRVLNGSGKTGLAATAANTLKDLGYKTDKTGNATNSAFPQTVVRVKKDKTDILNALIQDLKPDYEAVASTDLKDADTVDAEIILGTK
jgi:hypothetical protein